MRSFRWIIITGAVLVGLAVVAIAFGALWLNTFIQSDAFKTEVESRASQSVGAPVQLQSISFNIFQGVKLQGLVTQIDPSHAGGQGALKVQVASVNCAYSWSDLFLRKLRLTGVTLDQPQIVLTKQPTAPLAPTETAPTTASTPSGPLTGESSGQGTSTPFQFVLDRAKVTNGSLSLLVINKSPSADLPAEITLDNFTPGSSTAQSYSYGKPNDLAVSDITTGTAAIPGSSFGYTFPSYSMTVLVVKSQYENWREQTFTPEQLSNSSLSGDSADPAQDGVPNLMKYALGLNPNTPATTGLPVIGKVSVNGKTYLTLSFTDQSALTDITYSVQGSSDLQNWQSGPAYAIRIDNGTTSTAVYRDTTAMEDAPRQFLRLSVTRQ